MKTQPFPVDMSASRSKELDDTILGSLHLDNLEIPFALPPFSPKFDSLDNFVDLENQVQLELLREELYRKVCHVAKFPKPGDERIKPEKHLQFRMPAHHHDGTNMTLSLPSNENVNNVPKRSQWSYYFVVIQTQEEGDGMMKNVALAYCKQFRRDGVVFKLSRHDATRLGQLSAYTQLFCRPLASGTWRRIHFQALKELQASAPRLESSRVTRQILEGHLDSDLKTMEGLDKWILDAQKSTNQKILSIDINDFNKQQQRTLALDSLTSEGVVICQGPPGTGKSHILCHGLVPQALERKERVLVLCNSNVAVDALLLKCTKIERLKRKLIRCGYKNNVDDAIVNMGLYAEGDPTSSWDQYGRQPGSNSNTEDRVVQDQLQSKDAVFSTIHFASKEKRNSDEHAYWKFDTLILDEAAQLEDSKLFIVLARCPSLKKIILVGDPKQIQPYTSDSLRNQGYGKSTMERIMDSSASSGVQDIDAGLAPYIMLECQFRMAPLLRSVVSKLFYDDRLEDAACVEGRGPIESIPLSPLVVVNLRGTRMSFDKLHQSYYNDAEAFFVKEIYDMLFSSKFEDVLSDSTPLERNDVCVLSPYNRHKDLRMRLQPSRILLLGKDSPQVVDSSTSEEEGTINLVVTPSKSAL